MALITCPECGKEISDQAQACPHCGFPLSKLLEIKPDSPETIMRKRLSLARSNGGSLVKCVWCGELVPASADFCTYCNCYFLNGVKRDNSNYDPYEVMEQRRMENTMTGGGPIECVFCGRLNPSTTDRCLHCGHEWNRPISKLSEPTPHIENGTDNTNDGLKNPDLNDLPVDDKPKKRINWSWGPIVILIAVVVLMIIGVNKPEKKAPTITYSPSHYSNSSSDSSYSTYSSYATHTDAEAFVCAQDIVSSQLKSPSTAKFCKIYEATITSLDNGQYMVTGWVDAQNSFGATVRNNFIVTYTATEKGYKDASAIID